MRQYIDIISERANFNGDDKTERAFEMLAEFLGIHESGMTPLWRKLSTDGVFERQIDPRSPINKLAPEQWQRVQQAVAGYFTVQFADGILTISAT